MSDPLPLVILSGFLGAGKTTCLNAVLTARDATGVAVLVNEFGEVDVDGRLLSSAAAAGGGVVQLANGCICCTIKEDLAAALAGLLRLREEDPARVRIAVLETTGLADPGAIVRAVQFDRTLRRGIRIARVSTVCDAPRLDDLRNRFVEVDRQIGVADTLILNKTAGLADDVVARLAGGLADLNPLAEIVRVGPDALDPAVILGPWSEPRPARLPGALPSPATGAEAAHGRARAFAVRLDRPLDPDRLRDALSFLVLRHANRLLRFKGVIRVVGEAVPVVVQGVQDVVRTERAPRPDALADDDAGAIVFIGIDLPETMIRADLARCAIPG